MLQRCESLESTCDIEPEGVGWIRRLFELRPPHHLPYLKSFISTIILVLRTPVLENLAIYYSSFADNDHESVTFGFSNSAPRVCENFGSLGSSTTSRILDKSQWWPLPCLQVPKFQDMEASFSIESTRCLEEIVKQRWKGFDPQRTLR